jgi:putative Ca2+/H+ antiporter (TMEM165/GDT1 family)
MEWKVFATVFATVFLAELGDKTQLATMMFAADAKVSKWAVFFAASAALICAAAIGTLAGAVVMRIVPAHVVDKVAALGFIGIGVWMLFKK